MARNRSDIAVEYVNGEWMIVQRLNADDARSIAQSLGPNDKAGVDLLEAADECDESNGRDF